MTSWDLESTLLLMGKLRTWWHAFVNTFTSVEYYGKVLKTPFSFSLKFFLVYFLFYALIATGVITVRYLLPLNDFFMAVLPSELAEIYPEELVIRLEDGRAVTNVEEPYFIPMDRVEKLKEEFDKRVLGLSTMHLNNLIVIDTQAKIEDFPQYQTMALLTEHHLSIVNDDGNIESIPLNEADNLVINKRVVDEWMEMVMPFLGYIVPVLAVVFFGGTLIGVTVGRLLFSLVTGWLLWLAVRIVKMRLAFKKAWQLNLHFVVISTTGFSLVKLLGRGLEVPFLETLLVVWLGVMVVRRIEK